MSASKKDHGIGEFPKQPNLNNTDPKYINMKMSQLPPPIQAPKSTNDYSQTRSETISINDLPPFQVSNSE